MGYMQRIVSFDKRGRKYVTYRTMGDDTTDIEMGPSTEITHPACPGDQVWVVDKCVSPSDPTSGGGAVTSIVDMLKSGAQKLSDAVSSIASSASSAPASASGPSPSPAAADASGASSWPKPLTYGLVGAAAYLLWRSRKKKRS